MKCGLQVKRTIYLNNLNMNLSLTHTVMKVTEMEDLFLKRKEKKKFFPSYLNQSRTNTISKNDFFFSKSHSFHNCWDINN